MKEKVEKIKELYKDPKGKALLFFGFYLLFFLLVFLLMQFGSHNLTTPTDYEKGNAFSLRTESLLNQNYVFSYTVTLDDQVYEYSGKQYQDTALFEFQKNSYYQRGDDFFLEKDSLWESCDDPDSFSNLLKSTSLISLIGASSYEAKTTYESGKTTYSFLISTNTINQLISNINSDFLEEPNRIIVSVDEDRNIDQVIFYLSSYCTLNKKCKKDLKIEAKYSSFGEVSKIDNPIG